MINKYLLSVIILLLIFYAEINPMEQIGQANKIEKINSEYIAAMRLLKENKHGRARELLEHIADKGHAKAQYKLSKIYLNLAIINLKKATKSKNKVNTKAFYLLSKLYLNKSKIYSEKANSQNISKAQDIISILKIKEVGKELYTTMYT